MLKIGIVRAPGGAALGARGRVEAPPGPEAPAHSAGTAGPVGNADTAGPADNAGPAGPAGLAGHDTLPRRAVVVAGCLPAMRDIS
jgi:hypothetical protein